MVMTNNGVRNLMCIDTAPRELRVGAVRRSPFALGAFI